MTAQTHPEALRIAELEKHLKFVERWAVHHGTKPHMTAEAALGIIQHYPAIVNITDSYADGERPDTFDPYERIAELEAELVREAQRTAAEKLRADQMTEQHRMEAAMNAEARGELAQLREKRQPLPDIWRGWREQFSRAVYRDLVAADNQDVPLEEYPNRILKVLDSIAEARRNG